ncbi:polysaccharide export protein [Halomonas sp. M20]|uniref:polysaccharide export protein n=1 Tax=Halomonas sp. M20 TaxID=2763264 RepID=UPI001D0BE416|nr:polysaccharide export protein [Halomonas sp. M20]
MKKTTRIGLLAALTLSISACAYSPGGHIDYEAAEKAPPLDNLVDLKAITPTMIAEYRQQVEAKGAKSMSRDLSEAIASYEYEIGPGDVLNIVVYDHPELTIPAGAERSATESGTVVQPNGYIYYPYIGRVKIEGKSVDEVRRIITSRLSNFITEPQVEVGIAAFKSKKAYVTGAVGTPGMVPITNTPMTVLDVISQAGGPTADADWHDVTLNRGGEEQSLSLFAMLKEGDLTQNRLLREGDVVHVPSAENQNVAVLGRVRNAGNLPVGNERISLTDALARAGGLDNQRAEPTGIFVIRSKPAGDEKMATVYQLDITNAVALNMGSYFPLQPKDVVYVTAAPLARWNNVISLLLPTATLPGDITGTSIGEL